MLVRHLCAMTIAAALLAAGSAVGAEPEPGVAAPAGAHSASAEAAPAKPRLRFRSKGPACMCLDGLSEAEIAAAERARRQSADDLPAIIQNP